MANMCSNQLFFSGNEDALIEVKGLFMEMMNKEIETNEGQKPIFLDKDSRYFFDIVAEEDNEQISFESRWSPNVDEVLQIAKKHNIDFELSYQEISNGVYGKAIFQKGELTTYDLEDTSEVDYNEDSDTYTFREMVSDSQDELLEILFERTFGIAY
jgi:hypothetical protein